MAPLTTRDVARRLGVSVQRVRQYAEQGLLPFRRTPGGHRRYDAAAIEEARRRIGTHAPQEAGALTRKVREAIHEVEPGARVLLFGSRARGDAGHWSDWDLLVIVEGPVSFAREAAVWRRLYDVSLEFEDIPFFNATVVASSDVARRSEAPGLLRNAVREGIPL